MLDAIYKKIPTLKGAHEAEQVRNGGGEVYAKMWTSLAMRHMPEIPELVHGTISVTHKLHKAGSQGTLVSFRNALTQGVEPLVYNYDRDYVELELREDGAVWMTTTPQEIWQMHDCVYGVQKLGSGAEGLVAGLGLSASANLLARLAGANITAVEINQDVIEAITPYSVLEIHKADALSWIQQTERTFDFAWLDTWAGTGESTWCLDVVPQKRALTGKCPVENIYAWCENEMLGQIWNSSFWFLPSSDMGKFALPVYRVFREIAEREFPELLPSIRQRFPIGVTMDGELERLRARLLFGVGSSEWEQEFGEVWDMACFERIMGRVDYE